MRRTRRQESRVSYAEPPANLKDIMEDKPAEEINDSRPVKRVKRDNGDDNDEDYGENWWRDYVSDEILAQFDKTVLPNFPTYDEIPELIKTWFYQFVIAWFNTVCESYITIDFNGVKPLWRDIKFDEILYLNDLFSEVDVKNEDESMNLVDTLKLKLLRQLVNTKNVTLPEWDIRVKEQLNNYYPGKVLFYQDKKFNELTFIEQFEVLYYIIKTIETRNMMFKNYLNNHLQLFQFPIIELERNGVPMKLMILPNFGTIIEITESTPESNQLNIPVKLANCTILKQELNTKEVIHLDYSNEIDSYLSSIHINYTVKSWDWTTLLQFINDTPGADETIGEYIEIKLSQLLYSAKIINQREKAKNMIELINHRKRSSRLVARETELKRKEDDDMLSDKIDNRDHFMKLRHRSMVKYSKRVKDIMWNMLWIKYDSDFQLARRLDKHLVKMIGDNETLTPTDRQIINHGAYYTRPIIEIGDESIYLHNRLKEDDVEEIPIDLCINDDDIKHAQDAHTIDLTSHNINGVDNKEWIFHCICDDDTLTRFRYQGGMSVEDQWFELMKNRYVYDHKLICCDSCHVWEHWDCQPQENIDLLSQMHSVPSKKGADVVIKQLTERDFAIVNMVRHGMGSRPRARVSYVEPGPEEFEDEEEDENEEDGKVEEEYANDDDVDEEEEKEPEEISSGRHSRRSSRRLRESTVNDTDGGSRRRSARIAHVEHEREIVEQKRQDNEIANEKITNLSQSRPTDMRIRYGEGCSPYICGYCLKALESELRRAFTPELEIIRAKQRKGHDDRERRKQKKLEKQLEQKRMEMAAPVAAPVSNAGSMIPNPVTNTNTIPNTDDYIVATMSTNISKPDTEQDFNEI